MKISKDVKKVLNTIYYDGFLNSTQKQRKKAKENFKHFLDYVEVENENEK